MIIRLLLPFLLLPACKDGAPVDSGDANFPPGLSPLEDCAAQAPDPDASGALPETFNLVIQDDRDPPWLHLHGYVHASVADTWAALQVTEVNVDRRSVSEWSVQDFNNPDWDYAPNYLISNLVEEVIDIEFDIEWRHGLVEGTDADPALVAIRYELLDGDIFLPLLTGSILLNPAADDPSVTEIQLVETIDAARDPAGQAAQYTQDLFNEVVATVHGEALPTYD